MRALSSFVLAFDVVNGIGKGVLSMSDDCRSMVVALLANGFTIDQISEFSQLSVSELESVVCDDDHLVSDEVCAYISVRAHTAPDTSERREARIEMRRRAKAMLGSGVSQAEVSRKFGMSRSWSYVLAREMGLVGGVRQRRSSELALRRDAERARRRAERTALESEAMRLLESGMRQSDVASEVGRSQSWVSCVARSHGCVRRLSSEDARVRDENIARDARDGVTVSELMDAYGLSRQNLLRILREHAVKAQR